MIMLGISHIRMKMGGLNAANVNAVYGTPL
jgi:hypothetical protein